MVGRKSSSTDATYPKDFKKTAMTIFKRLFRVFAIIYCSHFDNIEQLGAAAHLNTSFKVRYPNIVSSTAVLPSFSAPSLLEQDPSLRRWKIGLRCLSRSVRGHLIYGDWPHTALPPLHLIYADGPYMGVCVFFRVAALHLLRIRVRPSRPERNGPIGSARHAACGGV